MAQPHSGSRAWLVVGTTFAAYVGLLVAVGKSGILLDLPLPWWIAQGAPLLLYALLTAAVLRPASAAGMAAGLLPLCAAHLVVGMLTEPIFSLIGAPGATGTSWSFPPAPFPQVLWVPVLLLPLRARLVGRPERRQAVGGVGKSRPVPERRVPTYNAPMPAARAARPPDGAPAAPRPAAGIAAGPAPERPGATVVTSMAPGLQHPMRAVSEPLAAPQRPGSAIAAPRPVPAGEAGIAPLAGAGAGASRPPVAGAAVETIVSTAVVPPAVGRAPMPVAPAATPVSGAALDSAPPARAELRSDDLAERDGSDAPLRVSARRVLEQLPAEALAVPLDQLLNEPDGPSCLFVPRRMALAQLANGVVRVGWDLMAPQIASRLLAMSHEDIAARLPDGQCVMPLDEIVRQFSADVFALEGPGPDLRGIEQFPAPFRPIEPAADEGGAPAAPAPVPVPAAPALDRAPAPSATSGSATAVEPPPTSQNAEEASELAVIPSVPTVSVATPTPTPPPPDAEAHGAPTVGKGPGDLAAVGEALARSIPEEADGSSAPVAEPRVWDISEDAPAARTSASVPAPLDDLGLARRLVAQLPPIGPLAIAAGEVDGVTLLSASSAKLGGQVAATVASLVLPLLTAARAPWPIDQITLRGPREVVVLTPLGTGPSGPVLAAAVPPGGVLALLELRCRQAAVAHATGGAAERPAREREDRDEPDLLDVDPPTRVREVASRFGAPGTVTASALRDAGTDRALYLFLPPGSDVRGVGAFAQELSAAMQRASEAGITFTLAVLRSGNRRLVIRPPASPPGHPDTIVAAGDTARPGLASRQVEQAAAALRAP